MATETDWRNQAACRDHPEPELFHPVGNTGPALLQIENAKDFCRRCGVVDACLAWALAKADFGVYGGTSEDERRSMKRRAGRSYQSGARAGRKKAAA